MIRTIGRKLYRVLSLLMWISLPCIVQAATIVTMDRQQITIEDSFQLTIRVTGGEDINDINLVPLNTNFEILGRNQNSRHIFGSGGNESWSELILTLAPKNTGVLTIPPLSLDGTKTASANIIVLNVTPMPTGNLEPVFLELATDKDSVYVQSQLILTIKIFDSINLDKPNISELKLENAFLEELSQTSGQRRIQNMPYLVHEIKYAIFPQKSGALHIPALTFSGTQLNRRRSLFDLSSQGKTIRKRTEATTFNIKPIPIQFSGQSWLPADELSITESWSKDPAALTLGESTTRTLTIHAKGLLAAQLPPLLPPIIEWAKFYPDQPKLENNESGLGISSQRIDSSAMVLTKAGEYRVPEIKVAWWDTKSNTQRWATIPARSIIIENSAGNSALNSAPLTITPNTLTPADRITADSSLPKLLIKTDTRNILDPWKLATIASVTAWLITLLLLARKKKKASSISPINTQKQETERQNYKTLQKACNKGTHKAQRAALIQWAQSYWNAIHIETILEIIDRVDDPEIKSKLQNLDAVLYGDSDKDWNAAEFIDQLHQYRKKTSAEMLSHNTDLPPLYTN